MKTTFLIDGFNLYHSAVEASRQEGGATSKWLDVRSFLCSCLPLINPAAELEAIHYFSALAHHREDWRPGSTQRHRRYLDCLESTGIVVELGRFKPRFYKCRSCKVVDERHEEKETDVAIGVKLLEIFLEGGCDAAVLVTGDTDLVPAIRAAKRLCPDKKIWMAFPFKRRNDEFKGIVDGHFRLKSKRYVDHQFQNPVVLPSGQEISKPAHW